MDEGKRGGKGETLEVTGVSRSGRVRKKSSKLMDFESPDEVDKYKRKGTYETTPKPEKSRRGPKPKNREEEDEEAEFYSESPYAGSGMPQAPPESDSEGENFRQNVEDDEMYDVEEEEEPEEDDEDDEDYEGNLVVDEKAPSQSLYMTEKYKRNVAFKDGKPIKTHRRDKGKSRYTAYMMWSREVRQALLKQFPDMDFSTMARRLSEMWATVPNSERDHWKRKAKREGLKKAKAKPDAPLMPSRKFINKKGSPIAPLLNAPVSQPQKMAAPATPEASPIKARVMETSPAAISAKGKGLAPIDVAAHLKLLGESLSIIGERLQEHEGQIAVSGSLSVLLDSLLCAMGPLLCLTQQVDKMQTEQEVLSNILHNTAYIMPGLG